MKRLLHRKCGSLCNKNQSMSLFSLMNKGGIGMLARSLMGDDWEVRHASLCYYKTAEQEDLHWPPCVSFVQASDMKEIMLLQHHLPTHSIAQNFLLLQGGCTQIGKPSIVFFLFFFHFLLIFYLRLALLLPRPQIKQLGTFILYLTTDLPRLNNLDRFLSLIYNKN